MCFTNQVCCWPPHCLAVKPIYHITSDWGPSSLYVIEFRKLMPINFLEKELASEFYVSISDLRPEVSKMSFGHFKVNSIIPKLPENRQ